MSVVKKSIDKKLSEEKIKIHRWDAVMTAKNDLPAPMIYIKPTIKFLEFIENMEPFSSQWTYSESYIKDNLKDKWGLP